MKDKDDSKASSSTRDKELVTGQCQGGSLVQAGELKAVGMQLNIPEHAAQLL
jgi:hypothetical protein